MARRNAWPMALSMMGLWPFAGSGAVLGLACGQLVHGGAVAWPPTAVALAVAIVAWIVLLEVRRRRGSTERTWIYASVGAFTAMFLILAIGPGVANPAQP